MRGDGRDGNTAVPRAVVSIEAADVESKGLTVGFLVSEALSDADA